MTTHTNTSAPGPPRRERRRRALMLVPLLALTVAVVWPLMAASGSSIVHSLEFEPKLTSERVFSTRAHIVLGLFTGELEEHWQAEIITVQALKEAEAKKEEAKWIVADTGKNLPNGQAGKFPYNEEVFLGISLARSLPGQSSVVYHLLPLTAYVVRFRAEDSEHKTVLSKEFGFTTLGVVEPEIVPPEFFEPLPGQNLVGGATSPKTAMFHAGVETNGAATQYEFSYAPEEAGHAPPENSPSWKPFSSGATGAVTVAEDFAVTPEATITGLTPEATYFARVQAKNSVGKAEELERFTTPTARPVVGVREVRNVTATTAHVEGDVTPHDSETSWRFEITTTPENELSWVRVSGAEGVVTKAQAKALEAEGRGSFVQGQLAGLSPSSVYYVRLYAENEVGEGRNSYGESILTEKQGFESIKTFGSPTASTLAVHGLHGEALRIMGAVNPNSVLTSSEQEIAVEGVPSGGTFTLAFNGQTTGPIAFDAPAEGEHSVLEALQKIIERGEVAVTGEDGGPYTVYFLGRNGGVSQPAITADSEALTPSGSVKVTVLEQGGNGYDTHYHFEYVSQKQFEETGWSGAPRTSEEDLGSGDSTVYVGVDLPPLTPGETYRFRLVATNMSPGDPVVDGEEQVLTVPVAPAGTGGEAGACPNEELRTGLSAGLPDCRAYEQVTPVDKRGAAEIFNYGANNGQEALPGEDGNDLEYEGDTVKWGSGPGSGQSPYFFSRGESGWSMTAAAAQPVAGVSIYHAQLLAPDLGVFAFEAQADTSLLGRSLNIEFETGPPGGPYSLVTSVPRGQVEGAPHGFAGWVATSKDFSTLVLQVEDHTLLGHTTHTQEGADLYEYWHGKLRQVNVTGSCGATIALGSTVNRNLIASSHAVSEDGSRVFFEAVPGKACGEAKHVYVCVNHGMETIDIGGYRFIAADSDGSEVLLEKPTGENPGLYLYNTNNTSVKYLPSSAVAVGAQFVVSEDLSTVYIRKGGITGGALYRYNVRDGKLLFVTQMTVDNEHNFYASSPDGRYFYFIAQEVAGLPGGGQEPSLENHIRQTSQVWRYDSVEAVVQCVSCSSSFDPEPGLSALFTEGERVTASADGDFVFFDTPAALVSGDVDGEVWPGSDNVYSLSSDVYEWRRVGVDGCSRVQGCLALITSGHGGYLNKLIGTTPSGQDVFFSTNESLVKSDKDTAGDIYDARVDGGFAEPPSPVECEGDACSTPFSAPSDVSPASASFLGAGNITPTVTANKSKPKANAKPRCKAKAKAKSTRKCKTKTRKHATHAKRRAKHSRRNGR